MDSATLLRTLDAGHTPSLPRANWLFFCLLILLGAMGAAFSKWASTYLVPTFPGIGSAYFLGQPTSESRAAGLPKGCLGNKINDRPWDGSRHGELTLLVWAGTLCSSHFPAAFQLTLTPAGTWCGVL